MHNWRAALVAAMVANTARNPKKRKKPYVPADFLPASPDDEHPSDWTDLASKAAVIFNTIGAAAPPKPDKAKTDKAKAALTKATI